MMEEKKRKTALDDELLDNVVGGKNVRLSDLSKEELFYVKQHRCPYCEGHPELSVTGSCGKCFSTFASVGTGGSAMG